MASINKVFLLGNVGQDPTFTQFDNGGRIGNLSLCTMRQWKQKGSSEKGQKVEWHRVVIKNPTVLTFVEAYVQKGDKIWLEGTVEYRKYKKNGEEQTITEIVINYDGELQIVHSTDEKKKFNHPAPESDW